MSFEIHPYLDEHGLSRAVVPEGLDALGAFLEQDVQSSVWGCDEILSILTQVEQGKASTWKGTGNAFTLTLTPQGVLIECEFAEDYGCRVSHTELREALRAWRAFVVSKESNNAA